MLTRVLSERFTELLHEDEPDLLDAALVAGEILADGTTAAAERARRAREQFAVLGERAGAAGVDQSFPRLVRHVGADLGFTGDAETYYALENSDLIEVLNRRRGIPITLAIVYLTLGRQLGFDVRGIGFPGHFLVGEYSPTRSGSEMNERHLLDPFNGQLVDRDACVEMLSRMQGQRVELEPQWFVPVTHRQLLLRFLENLKQNHLRERAAGGALKVLELQLLVMPDSFELRAQQEALLGQLFGSGRKPTVH